MLHSANAFQRPENQLVALAHSLVARGVIDEMELQERLASLRLMRCSNPPTGRALLRAVFCRTTVPVAPVDPVTAHELRDVVGKHWTIDEIRPLQTVAKRGK